jgi:hypothetical protein
MTGYLTEHLATGAISATGNLILAVGEGGSVDLRDNQSQVFQVAGEVTIASDDISLDEESSLDDLIRRKSKLKHTKFYFNLTLMVPDAS